MNALGTHLLLELNNCNPRILNDLPFVRESLLFAAKEAGGTILSESFHQFEPQGVTGIVAIAESHVSIHTWPEYGYAAADIFTCGEHFKPERAAQLLIDRLEVKEPSIMAVKRGILPSLAKTRGSAVAAQWK